MVQQHTKTIISTATDAMKTSFVLFCLCEDNNMTYLMIFLAALRWPSCSRLDAMNILLREASTGSPISVDSISCFRDTFPASAACTLVWDHSTKHGTVQYTQPLNVQQNNIIINLHVVLLVSWQRDHVKPGASIASLASGWRWNRLDFSSVASPALTSIQPIRLPKNLT